MAIKRQPSFDPKSFLAKVGEGRSIVEYGKDDIVFAQGDSADAVFYIQRGKVKVTVVSKQGKEAVVAIHEKNDFFGDGCLAGQAQRIATVETMTDSVREAIQHGPRGLCWSEPGGGGKRGRAQDEKVGT